MSDDRMLIKTDLVLVLLLEFHNHDLYGFLACI